MYFEIPKNFQECSKKISGDKTFSKIIQGPFNFLYRFVDSFYCIIFHFSWLYLSIFCLSIVFVSICLIFVIIKFVFNINTSTTHADRRSQFSFNQESSFMFNNRYSGVFSVLHISKEMKIVFEMQIGNLLTRLKKLELNIAISCIWLIDYVFYSRHVKFCVTVTCAHTESYFSSFLWLFVYHCR